MKIAILSGTACVVASIACACAAALADGAVAPLLLAGSAGLLPFAWVFRRGPRRWIDQAR